jgi:LPXTG-motif cell wall-anchored protein
MTFTPEPGFTGTPAPLAYTVLDSNGVKASSTYTPTVIAKPIARPDVTTGNKDVNQVINLITNPAASGTDAPGVTGVTLDPASVRLCAIDNPATTVNEAQSPPNCTATTLIVAGVGTYTVDATGQMTFDPLPTYTGTPAPVTYIVRDSSGQVANSTYTPTVFAPPTVRPDTSVGPQGVAQTRNVITNTVNTGDSANGAATLDLASLAISCPSGTTTPAAIAPTAEVTCTFGPNGEVIMAGQGTYTIDPNNPGSLIFTPEPGFVGTAIGVKYSITDSNGQTSSTTYTPTVLPAPSARDDYSVAEQGATQWISPIGNDTGSAEAKLLPGTVFLCRTGEPPPDCEATEVVIPGQGKFTVSAFGVVKFVPEPGFTGTVTPLNYQVADSLGQKTDATIFVEVLPPPAPSATMDTGSADFNSPVTLSPWLNDFAGSKPTGSSLAAPALVPSSIRLCTTVQTPPNCDATQVTTVDGTYVVDTKTGEVVFTPVPGFIGTVTAPVTYQISNNWTGSAGPGVTTSILVPTINPPGAPGATVDITATKPGVSVVIIPTDNDKPGSAPLDPTTIKLCGADEISPECTQMSVTTLDGTYVIDPQTGHVTFTPRAGFTGKATIPYIIHDTLGNKANANIIITVEEAAVVPVVEPVIAPQTPVVTPVVHKKQLPKTGGTRPDLLVLLGFAAIAGAGGLRVAARKS